MKQKIMIVPKGEYPHPAGVVQVIDDAAIAKMAASFDPAAKLLFDFDHYSDLTNSQREAVKAAGVQLPSEAAGWVTALEAKPDGLYGEVEWTGDGARALANGSYRFRSPVFRRKDVEVIGDGRVRPTALYKVGLTNEPNMRSLPALVNDDHPDSVLGPLVENAAICNREENEMEDEMKKKLIAELGLAEDATEEQIAEAVAAKKAEAEQMSNRIKELEAENTTLANRIADIEKAALKAKVDAALKAHEGVIQNREAVETALTKDFDGTLAVLKGLKLATLPNRADGDIPPTDKNDFEAKVKAQAEAIESYCNRNPGASRTQAYGILVKQGHEAFK
jgi:phage I-like protein